MLFFFFYSIINKQDNPSEFKVYTRVIYDLPEKLVIVTEFRRHDVPPVADEVMLLPSSLEARRNEHLPLPAGTKIAEPTAACLCSSVPPSAAAASSASSSSLFSPPSPPPTLPLTPPRSPVRVTKKRKAQTLDRHPIYVSRSGIVYYRG